MWNKKKTQNSKETLSTKSKARGTIIPDFNYTTTL